MRAHRLLDGLYPARAEKFRALRNHRKYPDNHFAAASSAKTRGEMMKVLYEHAFLLENKPKEEQNDELVNLVRSRIMEMENFGKR